MRARLPDATGEVAGADGVRIAYEVHGEGEPTVLLIPPSPITHSRCWKAQVPHLARHQRVVTFDGRGNGRSDRPDRVEAYTPAAVAGDIRAVLDVVDATTAVLVSHCHAALWAFMAARTDPSRIAGVVAIAPGIPWLGEPNPRWAEVARGWDDDPADPQGWAMCNPAFWRRGGYEAWIRFWFDHLAVEPHSTRQVEDMVAWALETDPETMVRGEEAESAGITRAAATELCRALPCPVLVLHGTEDRCQLVSRGEAVAQLTGGRLVRLEGAGHLAPARHPVVVNTEVQAFVDAVAHRPARARRTWSRALARRPRALYVSSPIGLGHARRDLAIAEELRRHHPDLAIDWLAQHPVTTVLEAAGEPVHPASRWLASESAHMAGEASGHDLHAFQALRRMDEVLVANFMVFQQVVEEGAYDLVIADEAWDVDHFWHENPELKRGAHVWMTDFVGCVPMAAGGPEEAALTADRNAEMVAHIARYPRVRDRSVFVGDPDDLIEDPLGPDLPSIRDWTTRHFAFAGYVTGFVPPTPDEASALRAELGYRDDERVCVVTVGGSGVGGALLHRVVEAHRHAAAVLPDLRMVVVAGPRIDPGTLAAPPGVEVVGYVDRLHRHLSVCDLAVVQGGLSTTMELTAARRPFLYFPLRNHFEQQRHVRHRLDRYRAGRCMDFDRATPEDIAAAMVAALAAPVDYRPVAVDGAARAAALIAEVL